MNLSEEECVLCKEPAREKRPWTTQSLVVAGVSGAVVVGVYSLTIPFVAPAFRRVCLPFVPATTNQVNNVMRALHGRKGTLLDIGSGDGRIVIEASKNGFQSHGVELNYWLVLYSRYRAWREGQRANTNFHKQDLWKTDMSKYENIVVFGVDTLMIGLEKKFDQEITDTCRIVASRFPLPNWQPVKIIGEGLDTVWIYMHPRNPDYEKMKLSVNFKGLNDNIYDSKNLEKDEFSASEVLYSRSSKTSCSL
ncbi:ATP synthase subunit C lysine N-methyltransferase-like [Mercenaria mercenaria]|uniref:ATP synthase subunit C lysine N-methyltransferase-like n=1 Tax=Mercenaria mercenaria TaxID=6596 RepID=UPI00234F0F7F|nr:ATP synthase subunit C lysine N-methyltransferase-like [Mercenaria mercenaria]